MSRSLLSLGTVTTLIALAAACSSHWSTSVTSEPVPLALDADGVATWDVRVSLEGDGKHPLPCAGLSWDLAIEVANGAAGDVAWEVTLGGPTEPTSEGDAVALEDGGFSVVAFAGWTETTDDRCAAEATLAFSSIDGASGDLVLRATASDESAGSGDEPEGEVALTVEVVPAE